MRLFFNSLAASAGGGLTYIRNVLPHLALEPGLEVTVALPPGLKEEFRRLSNIEFLELATTPTGRFRYEQSSLPEVLRRGRFDVLLSAGNFALRRSPVPQILLSRNSIYTSGDFYRDLIARREYRAWWDTRLRGLMAKRSVGWADITVAPSEAFAAELRRWTGARNVVAIHHGFDPETFSRDTTPLPAEVEEKLCAAGGSFRLLLVSHYNYYRNFETIIRALPLIRDRLAGRTVRLLLTCRLAAGENPGAYRAEGAANLARELGVQDLLVELGPVPYRVLHHLYRRADAYVTAAYTETFAHPLVEAMSCGLPVAASDLPVHREICGDAAVYFSKFSPQELTDQVVLLASSPDLCASLSRNGMKQGQGFSWDAHCKELLSLMYKLHAARMLRERKTSLPKVR